jgi:2-aminobenzoate-CoA ligase
MEKAESPRIATAHVDTFAADHLPPRELWPILDYTGIPELAYPASLNCSFEFLERNVAAGNGERVALRSPSGSWTYVELIARVNQYARVLMEDLGMVPGNRVLLRGPIHPMMAAWWFAVL